MITFLVTFVPSIVFQAYFGACLVACLSVCRIGCLITQYILPGSIERKQEWACMICHYGFRYMILWPCPWIRVDAPPREEWIRMLGKEKVFVAMNHTSFMDSVMFVALCPADVIWRYRTLMKAELFNIPLLCGVSKAIGHFPVHFLSSRDDEFQVERAKMAPVMTDVRAHVAAGGCLTIFPEGGINKGPEGTLLSFRPRSLAMAAEHGMEVVTLSATGCRVCWPKRSYVGGLPSRITVRLSQVVNRDSGLDAAELVELTRSVMQRELDSMMAANGVTTGYHCNGKEGAESISNGNGTATENSKND